MSRDAYYYVDKRNKKRHRIRVICMPGSAGLALTIDVLRPEEPPEWDAAPSEDSNFFRLHHSAISFPTPKEPQGKFEKWPIGMASTPVYGLSIDFARLYTDAAGVPSSQAQAFTGYVRQYTAINAGYYLFKGDYGAGTFRQFDTTNVWWILTDDGDATKTISQFRTVFCGVQRKLPQKPGKITTGYTVRQDIELYHIGRAVLDTLRMDDVCQHLVDTYDYHGSVGYNRLVDTFFEYSGSKFWWNYGLSGATARFYKFEDIFNSIETMMHRALIAWLRRDPEDEDDLDEVTMQLVSPANSSGASPWDHWDLYRQAGTRTTNRGTQLERSDWYVLGEIMVGSTRLGGLFHDGDDEAMIGRAKYSAWDFLSECGTGAICKMNFVQQDQWSLYLKMLRPKEALVTKQITRATLRHGDRSKPPEWDFIEGYEVIANVSVSVDGGYGDDCQPPVEQKSFGSRNEQGGTANTVFDVMPNIGEEDQWRQFSFDLSFAEGFATSSHNIPLRKIWYFPDEDFLDDFPASDITTTDSYPIRCHHAPTFQMNDLETYDELSPIDLPEDTSIDDEDDFKAWRDAMRVTLASLARTDGQAAMMGNVLLQLYSNPKMTKYMLRVPASFASVNDIGNRYYIGPASGGSYTAQPLANNDRINITDLPGHCYLLSVKIDDDSALSDIELLGVSTAEVWE